MKNLSAFSKIHLLLGAHIILWLNAANYSYIGDRIPAAVKFGLVGLWLLISLYKAEGFFHKYMMSALSLVFFVLLCILSKLAGYEAYFDQFFMNLIYCLIMIAVFAYYYYFGTKEEIKFLLTVFVVDVLIVSVNTYLKLLSHPELSRLLSTGAESKEASLGAEIPKGVGGYGLCYALVLLQPILTFFLNKRNAPFVVKALVYGFTMLLLFQAQFTFALIMYPILLFLSYAYGKEKQETSKIVRAFLLMVGFLLLLNISPILDSLIEISEYHLAERLKEVKAFLTEGDSSGSDMQARIRLYNRSVNMFLDSPIVGAFGRKGYGSHSTFLDMFAAYGLFGFFGYYGIIQPIRVARKGLDNNMELVKTCRISTIAFVFLSIINSILGVETMLVVIVIIPLCLRYFTMEEKCDESNSGQLNA